MTPAKVMIVEDNTTVAKDLQGCLQDLGYEVTSIHASGEEATRNIESECPDVVMMDIHLRDQMTGIEAAEIIHEKFGAPVVFLSAYSDRNLLDKAKQVGAFGYLVKPFEERELFANIEMAIYKFKAEEERRIRENQCAHMEKLEGLRLMAASLAHNFNNILQVPMGCNDLLKELLSTNSECLELIEDSMVAIKRASKLSQQMLVYVGQGKDVFKTINLMKEVERAYGSWVVKLPGQHSLKVDTTLSEAFIKADPEHIQNLVGNLVINATEAIGDAAGEIIISGQEVSGQEVWLQEKFERYEFTKENYFILKVTDTGCGMDETTLTRIFDPFFTTKFIGRGLGMAVSLGIVEGHGGAVVVESQPGEGTEVSITFPLSR